MTGERAPSIIVFDVNETLLDITTLQPLFDRLFGDRPVFREWFAQMVLYSQTMTLSGLYAPFGAIGVGALHMMATIHDVDVSDRDVDELKSRIGSMPAHPDAEPALARLRDAGFRLVTLTNSEPSESPTALERAGLAGFFERMFHVEAVRQFKPAPDTYRHVATTLDVDVADLCLVACHLWDTIGAQAAGGRGAFVRRPHNAMLPTDGIPVPDVQAEDLEGLASAIVNRWST